MIISTDFGSSWTEAQGVPAGAHVEADRVNANVFYAVSGTRFYVSEDSGQTFMETAAPAPNAFRNGRFKALPGYAGHIWLAAYDDGVQFSSDPGETFTRLDNVESSIDIAFGKAAPGEDYPALYLVGTIAGKTGLFRSDNGGETWIRINDDQHQWGNFGEALSGDPNVYGRVYVGTNGRGIIVGEIQ